MKIFTARTLERTAARLDHPDFRSRLSALEAIADDPRPRMKFPEKFARATVHKIFFSNRAHSGNFFPKLVTFVQRVYHVPLAGKLLVAER
jgi:hypothetical protein